MDIYKYLRLDLSKENKSPVFEDKKRRDILDLLKMANKELEKNYSGKYKFNLCVEDKEIDTNKLKLSPKKKRRIKEIWLKFDSELSEIQRKYESFLQKSKECEK